MSCSRKFDAILHMRSWKFVARFPMIPLTITICKYRVVSYPWRIVCSQFDFDASKYEGMPRCVKFELICSFVVLFIEQIIYLMVQQVTRHHQIDSQRKACDRSLQLINDCEWTLPIRIIRLTSRPMECFIRCLMSSSFHNRIHY